MLRLSESYQQHRRRSGQALLWSGRVSERERERGRREGVGGYTRHSSIPGTPLSCMYDVKYRQHWSIQYQRTDYGVYKDRSVRAPQPDVPP